MLDLTDLPIALLLTSFTLTALIIAYVGVKMAHSAEIIAEKSGLGQAVVGAVFLGISTSLSGAILSMYAAAQSHPDLAISNAIGGIGAQSAFLVVADLTLKRVNLEHVASSLDNLLQSTLLMILLTIPILAHALPSWTLFGIHPASFALVLTYIGGLVVISKTTREPSWTARTTTETQTEKQKQSPSNIKSHSLRRLIGVFFLLALLLGVAGMGMAETAIELAERSGLSETVVGGLFTSVTTSLPELITVLASVKRGAFNLAVGDIIGGNSFDVLFLAGSDLFYRDGSLYHEFTSLHLVLVTIVLIMSGVLLLGLLRRQKRGPAGIGFEGVAVILLYAFFVIYTIFAT